MNVQEHYNRAIEAYNEAINIVELIGDRLERYARDNGGNFKSSLFCVRFDHILQFSLLELACADGYIDDNEVRFTESITKHGDLMDAIENFEWEDVYDLPSYKLEKVLNNCRETITSIADEWAGHFSILANCVPDKEQLLLDFAKWVARIQTALCAIDGDLSESPTDLFNTLITNVVNSIEAYIK